MFAKRYEVFHQLACPTLFDARSNAGFFNIRPKNRIALAPAFANT
jgi:hypothetical protein